MRKISRPLVLTGSVCSLALAFSVCCSRRLGTKTAASGSIALDGAPEHTNETRSIVVYDGDCGVCEASARWVRAHVSSADVVSHHEYGLVDIDSVWFVTPNERSEGAAAVSDILKAADSRLYRVVGAVIETPGVLFVAELVYKMVAQNRRHISRLLGMNACGLPARQPVTD